MAETPARSWWAEVEHLREPMERRADERRSARRAGGQARTQQERRTIKIRGQAVPGAPRRALRDAEDAIFDIEQDAAVPAGAPLPSPPAPQPAAVPRRRRRPTPRAADRLGARPDRLAAWAVLFVLFMALLAATTGHG